MEQVIAGSTAALLTLFDLDRTFYVPSRVEQKTVLYCWWSGFVFANGVLAALLYNIVGDAEPLSSIEPHLRSVVIGVMYLALVRLKFATFSYKGGEVPFGLEAFYDAGKGFVFRRINRIAIEARRAETAEMARRRSLAELAADAKFAIAADALLHSEERAGRQRWLLELLEDVATTEDEKRMVLASYLTSGQVIDA